MSVARKRLLLVLASIVVSIELILQVGHLATVLLVQDEDSVDDGRQVVLCLGDSFTFGIGASEVDETSYPAALQRVLDERDPGVWRVVNRGHPGRNSRQLLERIDGLLEREQPDEVLILLGINDRWSSPERLELADLPAQRVEDDRGFRWEWRTKRLVLLAFNALREDRPTEPQAMRLATVEPFSPRLAEADAALVADREGAVSELSAEELLQQLPTGPLGDTGERLPLLRAAVTLVEQRMVRADALVRAFVLTGDAQRFREGVTAEPRVSPPELHEVCEALDLSRSEVEEVRAVFADALGWRQSDGMWVHPEWKQQFVVDVEPVWVTEGPAIVAIFETLEAHLTAVADRCRERGANVRFIGYPNEAGIPNAWYRQLEVKTGVSFLETSPKFAEELGDRDRSALFVPDGHCNDAGYRLLAEMVGESLLQK